jgi:hypothetical protein
MHELRRDGVDLEAGSRAISGQGAELLEKNSVFVTVRAKRLNAKARP